MNLCFFKFFINLFKILIVTQNLEINFIIVIDDFNFYSFNLLFYFETENTNY